MARHNTHASSEAQHQKNAKTDREVSPAKVGHGNFQGTGFVLHEQSQSLPNVCPSLWPAPGSRNQAATAAAGTRRATAAQTSNLAKLSWTSNEIDSVIEGCKILRSPCLACAENGHGRRHRHNGDAVVLISGHRKIASYQRGKNLFLK